MCNILIYPYRNSTIGKATFLLAVIIGIFGIENIFQYASLTDHVVYPYWGSLKAVIFIFISCVLFKRTPTPYNN